MIDKSFPLFSSLNKLEPDSAIVPKLVSNSDSFIPQPLSEIVIVRLSLDTAMRIAKSSLLIFKLLSVKDLK